ncbi:hypothetical protein DFJ69_2044 [Thermomonospora umbrina]|uniref:Uncharacterized protein n=1 Tax=Thermomonospora umbrina TaxID=111806 RepID=A0A3D9SUE0_9ACTN|nr:hypothetical protein DFJ69_2044 [Thermomonospora umbrina]
MVLLGHVRRAARSVASAMGVGNRTEVDAVRQHHHLDLRVHDRVALDEIELYSEILSAVASAERPLTTDEIDMALGVRPEDVTGRCELTPQ